MCLKTHAPHPSAASLLLPSPLQGEGEGTRGTGSAAMGTVFVGADAEKERAASLAPARTQLNQVAGRTRGSGDRPARLLLGMSGE